MGFRWVLFCIACEFCTLHSNKLTGKTLRLCRCSAYRYWVGVVYLKLSGLIVPVGGPGGEQVKEHLEQVHVLSGHVGDLKDWAHSGGKHTHTQRWAFTILSKILPRQPKYLSELKFDAVTMTSSLFWTRTGIFLQPGDFSNLCSSFNVSVTSMDQKI